MPCGIPQVLLEWVIYFICIMLLFMSQDIFNQYRAPAFTTSTAGPRIKFAGLCNLQVCAIAISPLQSRVTSKEIVSSFCVSWNLQKIVHLFSFLSFFLVIFSVKSGINNSRLRSSGCILFCERCYLMFHSI